jgi:RNA polymerase sigma factor (sigma-70 family)
MPVCYRYHCNEQDARSALNEGFMKILKGLDAIDGEVNFYAWSKRVMVNSLIDEYRRSKKHNQHLAYKESERELEFFSCWAQNDAENLMGYEHLLSLLRELPTVSAQVFNLYVLDGYSHKEIGEMLGISDGTSKWHLSTARKLLREKLERIEFLQEKWII